MNGREKAFNDGTTYKVQMMKLRKNEKRKKFSETQKDKNNLKSVLFQNNNNNHSLSSWAHETCKQKKHCKTFQKQNENSQKKCGTIEVVFPNYYS